MVCLIDFGLAMFETVCYNVKSKQLPGAMGSKRARTVNEASAAAAAQGCTRAVRDNSTGIKIKELHMVDLKEVKESFGLWTADGCVQAPDRCFCAIGTAHYVPPEHNSKHIKAGQRWVHSNTLQPGDMWAVGVCLLDVMSCTGFITHLEPNKTGRELLS